LVKLHDEHPVRARFDYAWTPLDAALLARITGEPDDAPGEGGAEGLGPTFPHPLAGLADPAEAIVVTPAGTEIMLETVQAALTAEQLGADDLPDLLALTFSGHDYAGHAWGQNSWERTDLLLRLDRSLAGLLDTLDHQVGAGRWALILAADHGAARTVEQQRAAGKPAYRLGYGQLVAAADAAAVKALGGKKGPWAVDFASNSVYFGPKLAALPAADATRARAAMVAGLRKVPGVAWAELTDEILARCDAADVTASEHAACLSIAPGLSGDIFVQPAPDSLIAADKYAAGTAHGSMNPDDTTIPLALLAPGLRPRRDPAHVSPLRVAPTLAKLLGIPAPSAAKEPPLY
jgi:hypothetical protein